ncbi:S8 family serine peptidase [Lentilactobacillus sunkii]|uniref:Lactocepin n=1 Tax=Lentilactobacillus sunkii DSM 19904 TaxID=1423808 RepID=A0A0R1L331_9LACO|nr:S8 family serine peptidase [Lentilactobacillus sunkii]KRK86450.1 Lactocepin [Lentilactobacillus sunkii DSM 19904]
MIILRGKSPTRKKLWKILAVSALAVATSIGIVASTPVPNVQAASQTTVTKTKKAYKDTNRQVKPSKYPADEQSLVKGNVKGLWSQGYSGQGMVIAIIDTGIVTHRDFRLSDNSTAKISKADAESFIAKRGYGKYISPKIPFAYNYLNNYNNDVMANDFSSFHGLSTAGYAAANGSKNNKDKKYVLGMAPQAQLLNMKVFGGFADEFPNDVSRAIYDAVALGANVINMSLGQGVPAQSLTNQEQAAVKYATDHGVFVSIASGNYAHSGSINSKINDSSDSRITSYEPVNSGTVSNPAVAASGMAVGSENALLGDKSEMETMSAWGPTPEYFMKPDISAPGNNVATTAPNNGYSIDSGTSMAAPFISGSAAIVMQKVMKEQPNLKGAALVNAVKVALMNAAQPMQDVLFKGHLVSPRVQGAGQVNVTNAGNLKSSATDVATGLASVSLHEIGKTSQFSLNVTNHSDSPQSYTVNPSNGPWTETRKIDQKYGTGTVYDTRIDGASLTSDQSQLTVDPGKTVKVDFTLNMGDQATRNRIAEGYVSLINSDSNQNISVPYMGYYGDPTEEQVIDSPANQKDSAFNAGYLLDRKNTMLGISDRTSLSGLVNIKGNYTDSQIAWGNLTSKIQNDKVAFSPNGDGSQDAVYPLAYTKQSLAGVQIRILNSQGKVIRTVDSETNIDKSFSELSGALVDDMTMAVSMRLHPYAFTWDGKAYDQTTGKMKAVPDGQYQYQIMSTNYNDGSKKVQTMDLPVKVDNVAPKIDKTNYKNGRLTVSYSDVGAGFTKYSALATRFGKKAVGVSLDNNGKTNTGTIKYNLTKAQQKLAKKAGKIKLTLWDVAGNKAAKTVKLSKKAKIYKLSSSNKQIKWFRQTTQLPELDNHTMNTVTTRFEPSKGIKFTDLNDNNITLINSNSKVYNATTHTLTIKGKVTNPKSKLTIVKTVNKNDKVNQVKIDKHGNFKYTIQVAPTTQRGIGYFLTTPSKKKATTQTGTLEVITDNTLPELNLASSLTGNQASGDHYSISTNNDSIDISGSVNDNVSGVRLSINGNNIYHQANDAGFMSLSDPGSNPNPYPIHEFSQTYPLSKGVNIFTVSATDQVGNTVTKTIQVNRE